MSLRNIRGLGHLKHSETVPGMLVNQDYDRRLHKEEGILEQDGLRH